MAQRSFVQQHGGLLLCAALLGFALWVNRARAAAGNAALDP